ncbi:MAG: NAD(P)(+) transhydrogenase (Re/Si-specific) subunit beta [Myxococcales bacterium]|nr:NAD(P)(+) transhydrogenase (Re/Si-specific) subunit beta [Myxococcales bacterium]
MKDSLLSVAYLAASALFILSLRGLSSQETARRGNSYGAIGMVIALLATLFASSPSGYAILAGTIAIGAVVGAFVAARVAMTSMPELVAILHSFVGAAAVLVGIAAYVDPALSAHATSRTVHLVEIFVGVWIGAITLTGSVIAFAKLRGNLSGKPLLLPGRHFINLGMLVASIILGVLFVAAPDHSGMMSLLLMTAVALVMGVHLVVAIGGADMPVVVSVLNSYSGWAAAAAGFMLENDLLIVTGALVGSSGAILSYIMCKAMNRSIWNVIFGGFGTQSGAAPAAGSSSGGGQVWTGSVDQVKDLLLAARSVIVVPGYGMAVARAQHPLHELIMLLKKRGAKCRYAIHPVAGRLPGHMNVLLAEANVPYDIVLEMEEIDHDFKDTDVVLVVGANDIVNPAALDDPSSPIYGMPVLHAWEAKTVVFLKRGMAAGYAGIDNPLFYRENTMMLFGDARDSIDKVLNAVKAG